MSLKAFSYTTFFSLLLTLLCLFLPIGEASSAQAPPERPALPDSVASVEVEITPPPGLDVSQAELVLTLHPGTEHEETERLQVALPFRMTFHGGVGAAMRLAVEAEGTWSAPVVLFRGGSEPDRMHIPLFPAGQVTGLLAVPRGEEVPRSVEIQLESAIIDDDASEPAAAPIVPATTMTCPVSEDNRFRCPVPATALDLRLRAEGFVPHYFRDVSFPAAQGSVGAVDLGEVSLERGGSVVGRVRVGETGAPAAGTEVKLEILSAARVRDPEDRRQLDRRSLEATSDAHGFFQLAGVAPGEYRLTATLPAEEAAEEPADSEAALRGSFFPLTVRKDQETELAGPLDLHPPVTLQVGVSPAVDLEGLPWRLELAEMDPSRTAVLGVTGAAVNAEGFWKSSPLSPGFYRVALITSKGARWEEQTVEITGRPEELPFFLDLVELEGTLRLGGAPIVGTVYFGGKRSTVSIAMRSNEEGRFTGILPKAGEWRVDVEIREPAVEKRLRVEIEPPLPGKTASLELDFGAGSLSGEVVDEDGEAVPRAMVWLSEMVERSFGPRIAYTDAVGEFSFEGVDEGDHILRAYRIDDRGEAASRDRTLKMRPDRPPARVRLTIEEPKRLSGLVLSPAGPVAGAHISVSLSGTGGRMVPTAVTGADGGFTLDVPPETHPVRLTLLPPGYGLSCLKLYATGSGLTLPVSPAAGNLTLLGTPLVGRTSFRGFTLFQDDAPCDIGAVQRWIGRYGGGSGQGLTVPHLSSGLYKACWRDYSVPDSPSRCQEGFLAEGGELTFDFSS